MPLLVSALVGFFVLTGSVAVAPSEAQAVPTTETPATIELPHTTPVEETAQGTKVSAKVADATSPATLTVKLTSYNAVPEQTDNNPSVTASGAPSNPEVVAARSRDLAGDLPFGTVIAIERTGKDSNVCGFNTVKHLIGYRIIADTMDARMKDQVDVLFNAKDTVTLNGHVYNPSIALGECSNVHIRIVGHVDIRDTSITQAELAQMFGDSHVLALK